MVLKKAHEFPASCSLNIVFLTSIFEVGAGSTSIWDYFKQRINTNWCSSEDLQQ